jgi:hypothetical protein
MLRLIFWLGLLLPLGSAHSAPLTEGSAASIDELARFVAGLPQLSAESEYTALQATPAWIAHSKNMGAHWTKLRTLRLAKMEAWYEAEFRHTYDHKLTMLYPFSGPDFVNAHALYPDANRYVFFALEDIDPLPPILSITEPQRAQALTSIDFALRDIYSKGYFITMHMGSDLNLKRSKGVLPILMVFLARSGHELVELSRVQVAADGTLSAVSEYTRGSTRGLRIRFRDRGSSGSQELLYFDANMDTEHIGKHQGFAQFLSQQKPTNTFLKAASYLMCCRLFKETREIVLGASQTIFQDDTGVPLRYLDTSLWGLQLYGEYTWPTRDFGRYTAQPDLMALYKATPAAKIKHLPFPMGYHYWGEQKQNHLMATRVPKPQPAPQSAD